MLATATTDAEGRGSDGDRGRHPASRLRASSRRTSSTSRTVARTVCRPVCIDRLTLTEARLEALADAVLQIVALTDPVGQAVRGSALPNGVKITQVRVPFGVVGAIYEARPNVTVDIAALALKSGNAVVLRGGSAAINTNRVLVEVIQAALDVGRSAGGVGADHRRVRPRGRHRADEGARLVDVLIPRGSAELISHGRRWSRRFP